jgi:SRSO17 transposase
VEQIGQPSAVLVLTEATFEKRGKGAAGCGSYYSRSAGRYVNGQLGVFLAYATDAGLTALVDRRLYVEGATQGALAMDMVQRALRRGLPSRWVAGSDTFGDDVVLRSWLEQRSIPYVLRLPTSLHSLAPHDRQAVVRRLGDAKASAEWTLIPLSGGATDGLRRSLLVGQLTTPGTGGHYLCFAPPKTPLAALVSVARSGTAVEMTMRLARARAGLDQYRVRGEEAWYRHMTLAMFAHAFLVTRVLRP